MLRLVALVLPLCLDTFAVCAALGAAGLSPARRLRASLLFPAVEAAAPLVGLSAGALLGRAVGDAAGYAGDALLIAVGVLMLRENEEAIRGGTLLALGLSAGLDELGIGLSIGLLKLSLVAAVALIAAQAVVASQLGLRLGGRVGARLRESAERLAGLALLALGVAFLLERAL